MLTSRLTWPDHLIPVEEGGLKVSSAEIKSTEQALQVVQDHNLDVLLWGDLTIVEENANLDLHVVDSQGTAQTKSIQTTMPKLLPELENVAADINQQVIQRPAEATQTQEQQGDNRKSGRQPLNPSLEYAQGQGQAQGQGINPQFRYQEDANTGRIRSQRLPMKAIGMVAGDADNNEKEEIILLKDSEVFAYRYDNRRLRQVASYDAGKRIKCLNINMLDMNRDGYKEIVVSAIQNNYERVQSFILNLKDDTFVVQEDSIDLFLNVVQEPPTYSPVLVGQKKGSQSFFDRKVHVVVRSGGELQLGRALGLPFVANAFNFNYMPDSQGQGHLLIIADNRDHLRVYRAQGEDVLYVTDKEYANTGTYVEMSDAVPGLEMHYEDPKKMYYIPARLISCDLDRNNRHELLVNRNISTAAEFFPRYRTYPQSEMHNLIWDGIGLNVNWKTALIKGMIADFGLVDMTGDGERDLVVAVNTHPGMVGMGKQQTYVLIYPLNDGGQNIENINENSGQSQ
ncbi:MAG: VCBS repeat-containing protein [Desulfovermiculus sp.]|nr:VCBS repeat-containing protein [Desulfovermiculus sp.]